MAQISLETNHTDSTKLAEWWKDVNSNFGKIQGTVNGNIDAANLENGAVTANKLSSSAVTTAKLADKAVTGAKIADYTIEQNQLAQGCVANNRIQNGAVDARCIADNAVTAAKIAAGAVGNSELAANAVTAAKLADNAVTTAKIADLAVGASQIADESVTSAKLYLGAVGTEQIAANAVTETKLSVALQQKLNDTRREIYVKYESNDYVKFDGESGDYVIFYNSTEDDLTFLQYDDYTIYTITNGVIRSGKTYMLNIFTQVVSNLDMHTNGEVEIVEEIGGSLEYDLTEVPKRVGAWIDGTPIWRIAVKYTITEQDITNGYIILEMPVKENCNYFIVNQFIQQGNGSPGVIDYSPCNYIGNGEWEINVNHAQVAWHRDIYGWVDFAAKASDLEQIEPEPETELVYIPKFKNSDVLTGGNDNVHPAFIVNGQEIPGFYYSKYQNCECTTLKPFGESVTDIYSAYGKDPMVSINFDNARSKCESKGAGWHLSTNAEWAAVALWSKKNGTMPYGNNDYGKDSRESAYTAIPASYETDGRTARVKTGTGPVAWSHDGTQGGVWDLNGNIWEWQGGIRIVWGELQILENNNAADPANSQVSSSTSWKAIKASDGTLVEPECSTSDSAATLTGNTVKLDYTDGSWVWTTAVTSSLDQTRNCDFGSISASEEVGAAAKTLLRILALLPEDGAGASDYDGDSVWLNNAKAEVCIYRGGRWSYGTGAGVFSLACNPRASLSNAIGFRSVYIPESE